MDVAPTPPAKLNKAPEEVPDTDVAALPLPPLRDVPSPGGSPIGLPPAPPVPVTMVSVSPPVTEKTLSDMKAPEPPPAPASS